MFNVTFQGKKSIKSKADIRFYGKMGSKINVSKSKRLEIIKEKVESLRYTRSENLIPNIVDRFTEGYLIDEIEEGRAINVRPAKNEIPTGKSLQKPGKDNMCFVGTDVISLFISLPTWG